MGHPHAASLSRAPGLVERGLPRQGDPDGVQELVCVAEKQSEEENATFISKQKQTHVKLLLCCCTRKPGQGSAQASAEASCSWLSLTLCPVSCSHSQDRYHGRDRLLLDSTPGCHCPVPQCGPEGERLPAGSSVWLMPLQGAGGRRGSVTACKRRSPAWLSPTSPASPTPVLPGRMLLPGTAHRHPLHAASAGLSSRSQPHGLLRGLQLLLQHRQLRLPHGWGTGL